MNQNWLLILGSSPQKSHQEDKQDVFLSREREIEGGKKCLERERVSKRKKERKKKRAAVADEQNAERGRHKSCVLYKKKYYPCQGKVGCPKMNDNRLIKNNGRLNDK